MSLGLPRSRKQKFLSPTLHKNSPKQEMFKSSPPISNKSPKYADHPPNAGHGFATLLLQYHLYYSTSCIIVSAVLQYQLYYSISCITVPAVLQYQLYYSTASIPVPAVLQFAFPLNCRHVMVTR